MVDISVVIPCRDGAATLGRQLDALLAQDTSAVFEVIIADNGSVDATAELVKAYAAKDARVRVVDASRGSGANAARNDGITAAHGEFILLSDADDLVHPGWIDAHWRAFSNGAQSVGGGINRVLRSGEVLAKERKLYHSSVGTSFANTTNCGFSVSAYRRAGGFDETFRRGADEIVFFYKLAAAGCDLVLVSDAVVDKTQHADLGEAFDQHFQFGVGEARALQKLTPRRLRPMLAASIVQSLLWAIAWAVAMKLNRNFRRHATCALAWNLGLLTKAVQLEVVDDEADAVGMSL